MKLLKVLVLCSTAIICTGCSLVQPVDTAVKETQTSEATASLASEETEMETEAETTAQNMPVEEISVNDENFFILQGVLMDYRGVSPIVEVPEGVTAVAEHAFWSNDVVEAVYFPSTLKTVESSVFWSCPALQYIDFQEGLETIGESICWSCPSLTDVNLPKSLKSMGISCFANCPELMLHVPSGSYAETYCGGEATITMEGEEYPSEVLPFDNTRVEDYSPIDRSNMILPAEHAYGLFRLFKIPEGTTAIGAEAFQYCEELLSIEIPGTVKKIGGDAFEYCKSLEKVTIQDGCEIIGDGAFEYCEKLESVRIPASVTSIASSSFDYTSKNLVIHCPEGSYAEDYAIAHKIKHDNKDK